MDYDDIRNLLETLISSAGAPRLLQLNAETRERAYEAYVAELVAQAVRQAGGTAEMRGINTGDSVPSPIVFRGSPGVIYSTDQNFCYYYCELGAKKFEIHLDVKFVGKSSAVHEIDVSVYLHDKASLARQKNMLPRANSWLIMTFECKFYEGEPGAILARTYVGLVSDCTGNKIDGFVANRGGENLKRYLSMNNRPEPFLDLIPGDSDSEDRFKRTVEQAFRKWASV